MGEETLPKACVYMDRPMNHPLEILAGCDRGSLFFLGGAETRDCDADKVQNSKGKRKYSYYYIMPSLSFSV